jgi:hypothetical protein
MGHTQALLQAGHERVDQPGVSVAQGPRRVDDAEHLLPQREVLADHVVDAPRHGDPARLALGENLVLDDGPMLGSGVAEASGKVVELRGFEPLTPRLPALCSPN